MSDSLKHYLQSIVTLDIIDSILPIDNARRDVCTIQLDTLKLVVWVWRNRNGS